MARSDTHTWCSTLASAFCPSHLHTQYYSSAHCQPERRTRPFYKCTLLWRRIFYGRLFWRRLCLSLMYTVFCTRSHSVIFVPRMKQFHKRSHSKINCVIIRPTRNSSEPLKKAERFNSRILELMAPWAATIFKRGLIMCMKTRRRRRRRHRNQAPSDQRQTLLLFARRRPPVDNKTLENIGRAAASVRSAVQTAAPHMVYIFERAARVKFARTRIMCECVCVRGRRRPTLFYMRRGRMYHFFHLSGAQKIRPGSLPTSLNGPGGDEWAGRMLVSYLGC